ncbi:MAG TPA: tol-pal system-associated acyl-CoA thioesterase [Burkholderiales bacterium]|jgi:acyl-CoA thioester hydrolase|nr:tol-pal system-associated acyl-CoA thioesterase [Burkholderiales bacterium]
MSRAPSRRTPPITHHSSPITFSWPVRIYHEDTDSAGVVYYANYLRFMERARTEWLRARGFEQPDLAREYAIAFVVTALTVEYRRPARFNDSLTVTVEPAELGASRIVMLQRVLREREELVVASLRLACVNTVTLKPVRIPGPVAENLGMTK